MKKLVATILLTLCCVSAYPQGVYFVDGYHGGIYGHYPVEWKTRFITDKLAEHPQWRICLEIEPETWDSVKVRTPEDYAGFRKIVANERIEFTNPTYAQPYCYNISGESIIRQFGYGIGKMREHFPETEFTTYAVEEPCFTSSLPQILKQFGFKYAVLKCPGTCWGGYTAPYGGELVNWVGPDGTRILTVPRYACEELEDNSVWQTKAWANSKEYIGACLDSGIKHPVGMCFQDAGWKNGPWLGSGNHTKNNSTYVTWTEYIDDITSGATDDDYRMPQEDVRVSLMWGSQVLQRIARQVRETENKIITAEKIGVMANIANGYRYSQETMDEAWRTLMLAQHHDSWIVPYNKLNGQRTWAQQIERWTTATNTACDSIIADAQNSFGNSKATAGGERYIRIYNPTGTQRDEPVSVLLPEQFGRDKAQTRNASMSMPLAFDVYNANGKVISNFAENTDDGTMLVFEASVPPFGYATYRIRQTDVVGEHLPESRPFVGSEYVMENDMYKIILDASKGGAIKSLTAKPVGGKEFVDTQSKYSLGELRGFFYDETLFRSSTEMPAEITVVKNNAFEQSVKISGHIGPHPFIQTITIREGQRNIDFDLQIDWQGNPGIGEFKQDDAFSKNRRAFYDDRFKLNVLFPVDLTSPVLYKNAPFDVCESKLENTHFTTWDSIKHNVILNWIDLAEPDGNTETGITTKLAMETMADTETGTKITAKRDVKTGTKFERGVKTRAGFALLSDHTTSYSYGEDFPLSLTAQYSGGGLWGRNYGIAGPLNMRFAIVPHAGNWDAAGIHSESLRWNEPLTYSIHTSAELENKSLIDLTGTGYEISTAYATDNGIILRLFNAEGDASPQTVRLGFPVSEVRETDLNGNVIGKKKIKKRHGGCEISVKMPHFGLKTLLLSK